MELQSIKLWIPFLEVLGLKASAHGRSGTGLPDRVRRLGLLLPDERLFHSEIPFGRKSEDSPLRESPSAEITAGTT